MSFFTVTAQLRAAAPTTSKLHLLHVTKWPPQLLLGTMLIEFTVQEFKRQQNKNNSGGAGSGGGAPKAEEMQR